MEERARRRRLASDAARGASARAERLGRISAGVEAWATATQERSALSRPLHPAGGATRSPDAPARLQ